MTRRLAAILAANAFPMSISVISYQKATVPGAGHAPRMTILPTAGILWRPPQDPVRFSGTAAIADCQPRG
jgi:hypothetical protein